MNIFALALLCIQACLVQNVFSQCLGNFGPGAITPASAAMYPAAYGSAATFETGLYNYRIGVESAYPVALPGPYGGTGEGNVGVAGELPVTGTTALDGQVPIMGAVSFGGSIPALGGVSITGNCACGCGASIPYMY